MCGRASAGVFAFGLQIRAYKAAMQPASNASSRSRMVTRRRLRLALCQAIQSCCGELMLMPPNEC